MSATPLTWRALTWRALRSAAGAAAALTLLAGCADKLDHFGKPPSFSGLAASRAPIDPSLPGGPRPGPQAGPGYAHGAPGRYPGVAPHGAPGGGAHDPRFGPPAHPASWGAPHRRPPHHGAPHHRAPGGAAGPERYETASIPSYGPPRGRASLWTSAPGSLFHDRRARGVGDILTVLIEIDDSAELDNSTDRTRSGDDSVTASTVYGLEQLVDRIIPGDAVGLANGVSTNGTSTSSGSGSVSREESISLRIAARVVEVLPNGHLVVTGNQEVRVNFELRDLQVAGIIRPEDITRQNTISYDRMANARISYGGRGHITDFQQPRIGQQLVDLISPF